MSAIFFFFHAKYEHHREWSSEHGGQLFLKTCILMEFVDEIDFFFLVLVYFLSVGQQYREHQ